MKKKIISILLILMFFIGLSLLLYPTVSDYINTMNQTRAIVDYNDMVQKLDTDVYNKILSDARDYNYELSTRAVNFNLSDEAMSNYNSMLSVSDSQIMGYIEIQKLDCHIPIYHGVDESILQSGIGHLEWSSLPVGGVSTHCVLSGHRGLPSAKLFSDLDRLTTGDTFSLRVLDEVLTYEVDRILIVEPQNTKDLRIVEGEDYCTLVTCTPYGVNSHRMLVRGHRIDSDLDDSVKVTADALQIDYLVVSSMIAIPVLLLLFIRLVVRTRRKKSSKK